MARRPIALALAALAIAAVAAGCGERSEEFAGSPTRVDLALDGPVSANHVGIYEGLARGEFAEAGLELEPRATSGPAAAIEQVAAGEADLAIATEPELMLARDRGLDVVAVTAVVPQPLASLISLRRARIADVADLEGGRVATTGVGHQRAFLDAILRDAGLALDDVKEVEVGDRLVPTLLSGRADASLGGRLNSEAVELELRGKSPRVAAVDELGVPTYDELVLVADGERVREDPEAIRLFIAALERGTRDAVSDPRGATRALLMASNELDPRLTRAEVARTLPLLLGPDDRPYGFMDAEEWAAFAGFMADEGQTERLLEPEDLLTNDLLPGRIPD